MSRPSKFAHWLASQSWNDPAAMIVKFHNEMVFAAAAVEAIAPAVVEFDGNRKYLPNLHGKEDQRQYYIASLERHTDGTLWPEITFGSFKARISNQYWVPRDSAWQEFEAAKRGGELTEDTENLKKYRLAIAEQMKIADDLKKRREQLKIDANNSAKEAVLFAIKSSCRPFMPGESHPYLDRKGLSPDASMRIAMSDAVGRLYSYYRAEWSDSATIVKAGDLVIPMHEAVPGGKVWSMQRINRDGKKTFPAGSRKAGLCTKIAGKDDMFFVAEGWATAKTANNLTGVTTFVAFDCGNLAAIVNFVKGLAKGKPVIVVADNDLATFYKDGKNPGINTANEILRDQQIPYVSPQVTAETADKVSDWDGLRQVAGEDYTKRLIQSDLSRALRLWSSFPVNNSALLPVDRLIDDATNTPSPPMPSGNASADGGSSSSKQDDDENCNTAVLQEQSIAVPASKNKKPPHWGAMLWDSDHPIPIFNFPHTNDKESALLDTRENLQLLLETYGVECRYNKISKDNEIIIPGVKFTRDNKSNAALAEIRSLAARNKMPIGSLDKYIISIADKNAYSPVEDWIKQRSWDGVDRIQAMLDTVVANKDFNEDLKNILIIKWMLACVSAVMTPENERFYSKSVLVLQGEQDAGKTSWMRRLVSPEMADYVKDGIHLDPGNKDTVFTAVSHWIAELGELDATFRKADIARLKAFITQSEDRLRRPYEARDSILPRRTLFFASVNDKNFLVDDTGNSRWWTIGIESVNYNHTLDMQQVWAQIYQTMYLNGAQHWLTKEEEAMLSANNQEYEQIDPIEERILTHFEFSVSYTNNGKREYSYDGIQELLATDILIKIGYDRPDQRQRTKVGKILTSMGLKPKRSNRGSVYVMPTERVVMTPGYAYQ